MLSGADTHFCRVIETSRERGRVGEISELVVVGIGYQLGTDLAAMLARRLYDFTAPHGDRTTRFMRELEAITTRRGQTLRLGGAAMLLELITDQIQPLVNERYRVDPADQAILGQSAGGNFVAHVLFQRPEAFSKYIVGSPAFAYNDGYAFQLEDDYARGHDDLPVTLYLAAASHEVLHMAPLSLVSGTARMAEILHERDYPGLRLACEILGGHTHASVYTEIIHRGLEVCWPGHPDETGIANTERRVAQTRS